MPPKKKEHTDTSLTQPMPTEHRLKKSVGAIHTSGNLSFVERKLANVLLYSAYDNLQAKRTHTIPVQIMCTMLGWDKSNRIDLLKEALQALQKTTLQFNLGDDGDEVWESMSMLSYAQIKGGMCTYRYDEALAEKLFDPAMFAMINLQVQRRLDSAYALNLYENCIRYKDTNTGSTGRWTIEYFREIVGASAAYYDDFRKLNAKIIKPSVEKINAVSDIVLEVEFEKQGRSVVALKFRSREKTEEEKNAMQKTLPGLSFTESVDQYQEVRNTPAFKALLKHGVSERLALAWIRERGEQTILELVAYTETKDAQNLIKTTPKTYLTSLIKAGADVSPSEYDKQKALAKESKLDAQKKQDQDDRLLALREDFKRELQNKAVEQVDAQTRASYAAKYLAELVEKGRGEGLVFNTATGQFTHADKTTASLTKTGFTVWLRSNLTLDDSDTAFEAWREAKRDAAKAKAPAPAGASSKAIG